MYQISFIANNLLLLLYIYIYFLILIFKYYEFKNKF